MESDREAALRRVAIVLSSLPAPVASRLLGTVDAESKRQLRSTMSALVDVDPLERRRALQAFKGSLENHRPLPDPSTDASPAKSAIRAGGVEDEIVLSRRHQPATRTQPMSRVVSPAGMPPSHSHHDSRSSADKAGESPLAFLGEVDDETLMSLLKGEHPQTIALVLASIAPTQAALILPRLDARLQTEALSRIGRLEGIPDEAVADIADHLRQRVRQQSKRADHSSGNRALNAILEAMPNVQSPLAATDRQVKPAAAVSPAPVESFGFPSTAMPTIDQLHRSAAGDVTWREPDGSSYSPSDTRSSSAALSGRDEPSGDAAAGAERAQSATSDEPSVLHSTDAIHQHLIDLSPSALCQALGKVETRVALLALCGLPSEVAESVLTILPRSHSKEVRRQLRSLGTLELREIDQAKEQVALASIPIPTASNTRQQAVAMQVPLAA